MPGLRSRWTASNPGQGASPVRALSAAAPASRRESVSAARPAQHRPR